jgi:hypothetical protein
MLKSALLLTLISSFTLTEGAAPPPEPAPVIVPPVNPIAIPPMCVEPPRPIFTTMEAFVKPQLVSIIVKYVVHDAYTGAYLREDYGFSHTVTVEEYEKTHGAFTEADWIEYCTKGYISVFRIFEEGLI